MEILCLDTDILIDFLRGKPDIVERILQLEEEFELATTTINSFELYYGAFKTKNFQKNINALEKLGTRLKVFNFTSGSAKISGEIIAGLEKEGNPMDFRDGMIAGIVLTHNVDLYTRNLRHFTRIKGLKLYRSA